MIVNYNSSKIKCKEKIPATVRNTVWNLFIGVEQKIGKCYCCKFENISIATFECGHVVSEKNNGNITIDNLRPVCSHCNKSIGTKNMFEFMQKYGFNKLDDIIECKSVTSKNNNVIFDNNFKLFCICTGIYESCNIRNGPYLNAKIIGKINNNNSINIIDEINGFYKLADNAGFVVKQYYTNNGTIEWKDKPNVLINFKKNNTDTLVVVSNKRYKASLTDKSHKSIASSSTKPITRNYQQKIVKYHDHKLVFIDEECEYEYECDICHITIKQQSWNCKKCNYDVCMKCGEYTHITMRLLELLENASNKELRYICDELEIYNGGIKTLLIRKIIKSEKKYTEIKKILQNYEISLL